MANAARETLQDIQNRQKNVGLAAVLTLNGETVLFECIGFADLEHRVPVTPKTQFGIASVTKAFTGIALLKLFEDGRIDLDAPIQQYLPDFPESANSRITPRLLTAHLAGVRHWERERTPELYSTHFANILNVLTLFKDNPLKAPPGSKYHYSSPGYNLLAAVIQEAVQVRFQDYVVREILTPLSLKDSGFDDVRRVLANRSRRYSYYDPVTYVEDKDNLYRVPEWDYSHNLAGGNMYATAVDLANFGNALTQPGLLSQQALDILYAPLYPQKSPWSFGWFVQVPKQSKQRCIYITGANPGVQAAIYVYPDDKFVGVILANTWGVGSASGEMVTVLPQRLAEIYLNA
ncbi:serine hydrolase domain-containing protein [Candidatus Leptofilum sp.]|uniref:serine hydrolase domain-containing protein n=1 Tax=Candidatus Leptofilum sp. TaxID=3241576 RepID=UPI003B59D8B1